MVGMMQEYNLCPKCGGISREGAYPRLMHGLCTCPQKIAPVSKHEQPTGFVVLDKMAEGNDLEQIKQEVQAMMDAYDGSLPFPEWAKGYIQAHSSRWDFHALAQFLMPPNDPRREPAEERDITYGDLGDHAAAFHDESWGRDQIAIRAKGEVRIHLDPRQFLRLLDWGTQHRTAIERLAKEKGR